MEIQLTNRKGQNLIASVIEEQKGSWTEYTLNSRGNKRGSQNVRNPDYLTALEMLLERVRSEDGMIRDILVASTKVQNLSVAERRVNLPGIKFPFTLDNFADLSALRKKITREAASVGRAPSSKGPGNPTRKLQLIVSGRAEPIGANGDVEGVVDFPKKPITKISGPSGPPPSFFRERINRSASKGFVYSLVLRGSEKQAIKIGFTSDLIRRIKTLNKEIHPSLTNCEWELIEYWSFESEQMAYEFEQHLNLFLRGYLVTGEREVFSLSKEQFLNKFEDFCTS